MPLLTLTPISKRGKILFSTTEPPELRELRSALRDTLGVPQGDVPPEPDLQWRDSWPQLAEFGLPGLCVPEASGGFGNNVAAAAAAAEVLGAALHGAGFAGIAAAAATLTGAGAADDLVADILSGTRVCGFGPYDEATGIAHAVVGAADSDAFVLVDGRTGRALLAADPEAWTIIASPQGEFDTTRAVTSLRVLTDAGIALAGNEVDGLSLYRLLLAADALGGIERSLGRTVAYCARRTAFGKVLGGFQAVQHRLVDHTLRVRGMSLAVSDAARLLAEGAPTAGRAVLLAEAAVTAHSVHVLHDLVQLTGGIGFTWEYGLHLFERRAQVDGVLSSGSRRALGDLARREGWTA